MRTTVIRENVAIWSAKPDSEECRVRRQIDVPVRLDMAMEQNMQLKKRWVLRLVYAHSLSVVAICYHLRFLWSPLCPDHPGRDSITVYKLFHMNCDICVLVD